MDFLPVVKLVFVLGLIVWGLRRKYPLGQVMTGAAIILGLVYGMGIPQLGLTMAGALVEPSTLELVGVLVLIMILEHVLADQGVLEDMVSGVKAAIHNPSLAVGLLPALIGLMPSAGGALFSCPLVDQVAEEMELSPEVKTYINYWFRHIWEYSFPLYPSVILTAGLVGMSIGELLPLLMPFTLVTLVVGGFTLKLLAGPQLAAAKKSQQVPIQWRELGKIFRGLAPVAVTVFLVLVFGMSVVAALGLAVAGVLVYWRYNLNGLGGLVRRLDRQVLVSVLGIMVFKETMLNSGVPELLPEIMFHLGLPVLVIVAGIPFLLAMLTGFSSSFIGVGIPLIMGFMGGTIDPSYIPIAYVCGFAGLMLTPLHLCFTLTVEYFRSQLATVWRWTAISQGAVVAAAFLFYWLGW